MSAMPIYGENKHLKIFFSRTKKASMLNLGIQHWGLKVYQVNSNDDSTLTFDLSMSRSNLHHCIPIANTFSYNQTFVHLGYLPFAPGLYTCIKSLIRLNIGIYHQGLKVY